MKNFFRSFVFAALAVITLASSRPSHAAVGAIVATPAVVTAGLVTSGLGVAGFVGTRLANAASGYGTGLGYLGHYIVSMGLVVVGLVVLDGEQGMAYQTITNEEATELNISLAELESFNSEIDQVNALAAYVDSELSTLSNPTIEDSVALWNSAKDAVTPETFSAMVKVTTQLYK